MGNIETIKSKLAPVFASFNIDKVALFGSYARKEETENSDIDLLIYTDKVFDLDSYGEFEEELEEVMGKKVDLVFYDYINLYMKDTILDEAVCIYE